MSSEQISEYPWINDDLFRRVIQRQHTTAKSIQLITTHVKFASGGHFGSKMLRASVNYKIDSDSLEKVLHMVIKAPLSEEFLNILMYNVGMFDRENQMYEEILPELHTLLSKTGDDTELAPGFYDADSKVPYLILEDVSTRHYTNAKCPNGLDFDHVKLTFAKLAKWHAAMAVLLTKNQKSYPHFSKHPMELTPVWTDSIMNAIRAAETACRSEPDMVLYAVKLHNLRNTILSKIRNLVKLDETQPFVSFCHGDFGQHNAMYKYNYEGQLLDVLLIDFQVCYIGPPIVDLHVMLFGSNETITERDWDLLLQCYHQSLSQTLTELNYTKPIPSLTQIQMQFLEKLICSFPTILMSGAGGHAVEPYELKEGESPEAEEVLTKQFMDPGLKKALRNRFDYLDRKGILD